MLWTARRQSQNAADAGALAGAVALAFDNASDFSNTGPAKTSAYQVLMSHPIWGQQPVVDITNDITILDCPDDATTKCVRVDVYRNTAHGNALPMIFGQLVGLNTQNVRAMAMAKVAIATATDCLKPWGVIDKWEEFVPTVAPWTPSAVFEKYINQGPNAGTVDPSFTPPDNYIPPTSSSRERDFIRSIRQELHA